MPKQTRTNQNAQPTIDYYNRRESRVGYEAVVHGTKHYGYYPHGLHLSIRQAQRCMESMLGARLRQPQGAHILDAGCGEGYVAIHLAQDFGYRITGIDLLGWSISEADKNKRNSGVASRLAFEKGDYNHTNFPDSHFDGIYTMETLVHSPDYAKTLEEFYRILKPGGVLVNQEYVLMDTLPKEDEEAWRFMFEGCPMPTFEHFRVNRMESIWKDAGFTNITVQSMTDNVAPFMKRFYQLAFFPFSLLRLVGQEKRYVNIYAAVKSYQLRNQFTYTVVSCQKP